MVTGKRRHRAGLTVAIVALSGAAHASPGETLRCSGAPRVPTAEVARGIAEEVIEKRHVRIPETVVPKSQIPADRYILTVEADEHDPRKWRASQGLPPTPPTTDGTIVVTAGGGGMTMVIDRCTGEVSDIHFIR